MWSSDGCELAERRTDPVTGHAFVTCRCYHLSTYAVIMDKSPIEVHLFAARWDTNVLGASVFSL